jgi:hypothetical protein
MTTSILQEPTTRYRVRRLIGKAGKLANSLMELRDGIREGSNNSAPRETIAELISLGIKVKEEYSSLFNGITAREYLSPDKHFTETGWGERLDVAVRGSGGAIRVINELDIETLRGNRGLLRIVRSMPEWTAFCNEYQSWCKEVFNK